MTPTRTALLSLPRPVRAVELPGGGTVHVRTLTIAELRRVDRLAEEGPDDDERELRGVVLLAASGLSEPDGTALFPGLAADDLQAVEHLTADQLRAVCEAAAGRSKADAKN